MGLRPSVPLRRFGRSLLLALALPSLSVVGVLGLSRCGADIGAGTTVPDDPEPRTFVGIRIDPDNNVLLVDLNQTAAIEFRVLAYFSDGSSEDISAQSMLSADSSVLGTLNGRVFTAAPQSSAKVDLSHFTARYSRDGQEYIAAANLTIVWLRTTGPSTDFFFSLPFGTSVKDQALGFGTTIQSIDSFFAVDTTSSMVGAINNLRSSLKDGIIPGVKQAAAKDAWFGVGAIDDFPVGPNGVPTGMCTGDVRFLDDQPFILVNPMTSDVTVAQAATDKLLRGSGTRGCGGDIPESQLEALYQIATGEGNTVTGVSSVPAHKTPGRGGVEFREGALPVITLITDAPFHTKGETNQTCTYFDSGFMLHNDSSEYGATVAAAAHTRAQTTAALNALCAKVIGVAPQITTLPTASCLPNVDLVKTARDTGALVPPEAWDAIGRPNGCAAGQCCTGLAGAGETPGSDGLCPLVFKVKSDGTGLGQQVTTGITQLARFATFDVTTSTRGNATGDDGETLPAGKTTADFIKGVTPDVAIVPTSNPMPKPPIIAGGAFTKVTPGTQVRFDIKAYNDFQPETDVPQVFRATIKVQAGGCADLDQREVIMLVPPKKPVAG